MGSMQEFLELEPTALDPTMIKKAMGDDPIAAEIRRLRRMAANMNTIIQTVSLMSSYTVDSSLDEASADFFLNIDLIRESFRQGDLRGAEGRVVDIVRSFTKYKNETITLYGRFTNAVKQFPKYPEVLDATADNLDNIRNQFLEDKVMVVGEEDMARIVKALLKIIESGIAKKGAPLSVNKLPDEVVQEKEATK